jgi:hypothetical protein
MAQARRKSVPLICNSFGVDLLTSSTSTTFQLGKSVSTPLCPIDLASVSLTRVSASDLPFASQGAFQFAAAAFVQHNLTPASTNLKPTTNSNPSVIAERFFSRCFHNIRANKPTLEKKEKVGRLLVLLLENSSLVRNFFSKSDLKSILATSGAFPTQDKVS